LKDRDSNGNKLPTLLKELQDVNKIKNKFQI